MKLLTFNGFNFDYLSVVLLPVDDVSLDRIDFNDIVSISLKTKRYLFGKKKDKLFNKNKFTFVFIMIKKKDSLIKWDYRKNNIILLKIKVLWIIKFKRKYL